MDLRICPHTTALALCSPLLTGALLLTRAPQGIGPIRCSATHVEQQLSDTDSTTSSADADECEAALESAMDEMGNINIYQALHSTR